MWYLMICYILSPLASSSSTPLCHRYISQCRRSTTECLSWVNESAFIIGYRYIVQIILKINFPNTYAYTQTSVFLSACKSWKSLQAIQIIVDSHSSFWMCSLFSLFSFLHFMLTVSPPSLSLSLPPSHLHILSTSLPLFCARMSIIS